MYHYEKTEKSVLEKYNREKNTLNPRKCVGKNPIVFFGTFPSFDKGTRNYVNKLNDIIEQHHDILVIDESATPGNFGQLGVAVLDVPELVRKIPPPYLQKIDSLAEIQDEISKVTFLREASLNIKMRHPEECEKSTGICDFIAFIYNDYCNFIIDKYDPIVILMWNEFNSFHHVLKNVASCRGVPVIFMEFGALPGSFCFEAIGQMGESFPARQPEKFNHLRISEDEYKRAGDYLQIVRNSGKNRNQQPKESCKDLITKIRNTYNCPIALYAGQNDFESGMVPYTENTRRYHSPVFESTLDALLALDLAAGENGYHIIFKPHPIILRYTENYKNLKLPNTTLITKADINEIIDLSDLTITILSQTAYVALIREKPVLMLGYTQLIGAESTYNAFSREKIGSIMRNAVNNGYTEKQKRAFQAHVARLCKYYLYDDLSDTESVFRKKPEDLEKFIENVTMKSNIIY